MLQNYYFYTVSIKSFIAKQWASIVVARIYKQHKNAIELQRVLLELLVDSARNTQFGTEFNFKEIKDYDSYKKHVPLFDYEKLHDYIERIKTGESNVLWPGLPLYFAKTSGTSSGEKFIPISKESISHHIRAARNALFHYIVQTGNTAFIDGKMIFLQGSPTLKNINGIACGRLSGIVYHHVPAYLQHNRMPSYETNCIEDWEQKVEKIAQETSIEDMRLISGIPPWLLMYFEKLLQQNNKESIKQLFPNLSLILYGGVNYKPYEQKTHQLLGSQIDSIETYPASEGFFAYQDMPGKNGLLLNLDAYIFYEFIELKNYNANRMERISLVDVKLNIHYVLVISSNAGLWAYVPGDVIQFVSLQPYRILVSGRTSQFISAFGEHVIVEEIESSMQKACIQHGAIVSEYSVAPQVNPTEGLPYHEWLVEFEKAPTDSNAFIECVDQFLQEHNTYYSDLRKGNVIQCAKITILPNGRFHTYLKSIGKLGGQNKIARVRNDRDVADALHALM